MSPPYSAVMNQPESGRTFRVGWQYFNGPTNQYEFLRRSDNQLGAGVWFDY